MQPKVAVLKPLSSAISMGSGGPFGAEGPIIMTGGAIGSIIAQIFHLTAALDKEEGDLAGAIVVFELLHGPPIVAQEWESCRTAAEPMAASSVGRLSVVAADNPRKVIGIVTRSDLLKPRARQAEEEATRRRFIDVGMVTPEDAEPRK